MKTKLLPLFVALFATLFTFLTASAQGEWKWAHYWTGGDGVNQSEFFNNVNNIAFDDDGNVYVFGRMGGNLMIDGIFLPFTTAPHVLSRDVPYQQSTSNQTFFVRYDTQTGSYINYGVVPAIKALTGLSPTVVNNRVFSYANMFSNKKIFQWNREGELIQSIDLYASGSVNHPSLLSNNQGYLLYSLNTTASVSFPNGISVNCPSGQSSAVFALYHDPEFATPYVGIPEYDGPEPEVRLWPNPATDKITIESEEEFPVKSVAITDMQGQLLAILPVNDVRCTLNVRNLAPGTYIAHVETKAGVADRKFVVGR